MGRRPTLLLGHLAACSAVWVYQTGHGVLQIGWKSEIGHGRFLPAGQRYHEAAVPGRVSVALVTGDTSIVEIRSSWHRSAVRQGVLYPYSWQPTEEFRTWCTTCEGRVVVLPTPVTKTENPARVKTPAIYFEKKTDQVAYFLTFDEPLPVLRVSGEAAAFYCPYMPP